MAAEGGYSRGEERAVAVLTVAYWLLLVAAALAWQLASGWGPWKVLLAVAAPGAALYALCCMAWDRLRGRRAVKKENEEDNDR